LCVQTGQEEPAYDKHHHDHPDTSADQTDEGSGLWSAFEHLLAGERDHDGRKQQYDQDPTNKEETHGLNTSLASTRSLPPQALRCLQVLLCLVIEQIAKHAEALIVLPLTAISSLSVISFCV
jgi:hypothetical protein